MSETRGRIEMIATLTDEEFKERLDYLQRQLTALKKQAKDVGEFVHYTKEDAAMAIQDVATMMDIVFQMAGAELSATQQAAINMIITGAMAYRHIAKLYGTSPYLAPFAVAMYAASFAMQINAIREVNERTQNQMQALRMIQFTSSLTLRYGA